MTDLHIKGGADLDRLLQTLPVKLERNIMRAALAAGARVIRDEAKRLAPVGRPSNTNIKDYGGYPGALRDSVRVSTGVTKAGEVFAGVKAGGRTKKGADVFYAHIVEFGARRHIIRPRVKKMEINGKFVAGQVDHPGVRPQPFLRPAMDAKLPEALDRVTTYIRKRLAKEGIDAPAPVPAEE